MSISLLPVILVTTSSLMVDLQVDNVSYAQITQLVNDQTSNSSLSLTGIKIIQGIVFGYEPEGNSTTYTPTPSQGIIKNVSNANVTVFTFVLDTAQTKIKGTILLKNADELINFTRGEEQQLAKIFKEITYSGIEVIIAGPSIGDLALHSLNSFDTAVLKQSSTPAAQLNLSMSARTNSTGWGELYAYIEFLSNGFNITTSKQPTPHLQYYEYAVSPDWLIDLVEQQWPEVLPDRSARCYEDTAMMRSFELISDLAGIHTLGRKNCFNPQGGSVPPE
ncbi:hypothetical protein DEU56DRAFT_760803 [Suillus clintonianus]|uniref:uncharacterized protein n=1 Tax=Suillus clintonianus TaxID=1904413 RepID=UPI001B8752CC|nr:uncharacterized protein DEU56DRAFT_760803 [Suillus clintonianus]KAG2121112.1 hypothetical protein DEU56DRAFT_760803 [Suillus clintonianus]